MFQFLGQHVGSLISSSACSSICLASISGVIFVDTGLPLAHDFWLIRNSFAGRVEQFCRCGRSFTLLQSRSRSKDSTGFSICLIFDSSSIYLRSDLALGI
jgi:hypothetical protein